MIRTGRQFFTPSVALILLGVVLVGAAAPVQAQIPRENHPRTGADPQLPPGGVPGLPMNMSPATPASRQTQRG